ncbi:ParB/RepB/Spo0J family partition protein [Nodosilinea sp. LEGE 07298]|uniref:ParB/RepB/Spo0J family partition protein n=1 Tax=Nodosilinea sp. LEGE 07298 TaxID=2777970 RepID=UPI00187FC191|nr:ParB/RepB/Spo0J family partition protein [Nodosilinea sp. LEGE 07298]MBE9108273.1 ParB/RepB/Spo0J family partition protein [Nodosilinea sp. LEGE 07298]
MTKKSGSGSFDLSGRGILTGFTSGGGSLAHDTISEEQEEAQLSQGSDNAVQWIPLGSITPGAFQPRQFFSDEGIANLAASFKEQGFRGAINVRPGPDGTTYELIAGERRWRAAKKAGLEKIRCIVDDYTDQEALEFALIENLQREDLSKLEETEGILQLISTKLECSQEAVITLIRTEGHSEKRSRSDVAPDENLVQIEEILSFFGIELQTFRTKNLRTLTLPDEVKKAHLEQGLPYSSALELAKVKDAATRQALLKEVTEGKLSFREVRDRVKAATSKHTGAAAAPDSDGVGDGSLFERLDSVAKRAKKAKPFFEKAQKRKRLERLLGELEALLEDSGAT